MPDPDWGTTLPEDVPFRRMQEWLDAVRSLGYRRLWAGEVSGRDVFTPLATAAALDREIGLATGVVPIGTRGPAVLAMSIASMGCLAPGRFMCGLGTSSQGVVEDWNAGTFDKPWSRTRDMLRFLRSALHGEPVDEEYETFAIRGFRLREPPDPVPPLLLAALRPRMLALAGREADGAILNWCAPADVPRLVSHVGSGRIAAYLYVAPDAESLGRTRRLMTSYFNVPVYAAYQEWLGRGPQLQPMWDAWQAGDRQAAVTALPDDVVSDIVITGSAAECRDKIRAYVDAGVTLPVIASLGTADQAVAAMRHIGRIDT